MNNKITGQINITREVLSEIKKEIKNISDFKKNIESVLEKNITKLLESILLGAINLNSSDIHIEPTKQQIRIRIRIDGILQEIISINKEIYKSLLPRIKLLSGIKINISDIAQDGRFTIVLKQEKDQEDETIEIRTSSLPSEYGESLVLRI